MDVYGGMDVKGYKSYSTIAINGKECCSRCRQPLTRTLRVGGTEITVGVLCKCQEEEHEARKARQEAEERRIRIGRLKSLSLMAGVYSGASFEAYELRKGNEGAYRACRAYAEKFDVMKAEGYGLLLSGPVGTGKSYTAACIANTLLEREYTVVMTSLAKADELSREEQWKVSVFAEPDLLIIDDYGAERETEYMQERSYEIIDTRVRSRKPLIVTTNISVKDLAEEKAIGRRRIYDRILEACTPVVVSGDSFRRDRAVKKQKDLMRILAE